MIYKIPQKFFSSNFDKSYNTTTVSNRDANGKLFTPPSCRQGSRIVGILMSAGVPVVPGVAAKIEARSLPSSRQPSPDSPQPPNGYGSEWNTPNPPKRTLLPTHRTRPVALPAGAILHAASAVAHIPIKKKKSSSDGFSTTPSSLRSRASEESVTGSTPLSPSRRRPITIPNTVHFAVPNGKTEVPNVLQENAMQGSDYDNLHEEVREIGDFVLKMP